MSTLRSRSAGLALVTLLTAVACGDTGRERVEISLSAVGTAAREVVVGTSRITLTRADLAYGPAYFCASDAGRAELCEVAAAELRGAALIRGLDPAAQALGALSAVTGEVRSTLYDFGIPWLLTQPQPTPLPAAPEGHSAVLEGNLVQGARTLRFRADIDVKSRTRGDAALNGQRTRYVIGEHTELEITADPSAWVERLDPDALFALDTDGDGFVAIPADSALYESLLQGLTARAPLRFSFRDLD